MSEWKVEDIDFKLLKEQKESLIRMVQDWGEADDESQKRDAQAVDGIIHMIDAIQDHAVDNLGMDESEVFNLKD